MASVMMLGEPVQIAYCVADVREAASRWIARGAGPFFVRDHIDVTNARVFGEPACFDHSSAYGQWGSVMVELICQHDAGPDPLVGTCGVHHLAFFVESWAEAAESLQRSGYPEALYAEAGGMPFGFFDARDELGHFIEIYEPTQRLAAFYESVSQAATNWNGTDPIRVM